MCHFQMKHPLISFPFTSTIARTQISVVGMGVRVPGCNSVTSFWNILKDPKSFNKTERTVRQLPLLSGNDYKARVITGVGAFDNGFFGMSRETTDRMDPHLRVLAEGNPFMIYSSFFSFYRKHIIIRGYLDLDLYGSIAAIIDQDLFSVFCPNVSSPAV